MTDTNTPPILAWHNDPALRAAAVERMRAHRAEDEFIQRAYAVIDADAASGYRGCFHGCLTAEAIAERDKRPLSYVARSQYGFDWHQETEKIFGIPVAIGRLLDSTFEALPTDGAAPAAFAVDVTEAIPVGADLSVVLPRLILDRLADDPDHALLPTIPADSRLRPVAETTVELYRRLVAGDAPADGEWRDLQARIHDLPYDDGDDEVEIDILDDAVGAGRNPQEEGNAATYVLGPGSSDDDYTTWLAGRILHHLAAAPIPAPATAAEVA